MVLSNMQANDLISYFHSIKSEADLKRMITDHVKEDLYLEFKQKRDTRHAQLADDDKFNFSRALSGFANSDSGILIWGIVRFVGIRGILCIDMLQFVDGTLSFTDHF